MAAPLPVTMPPEIFTPEITTEGEEASPMLKTWYWPPPEMVNLSAPGPLIVMPFSTSGSGEVSWIFPVTEKLMVFVLAAEPVARLLRQ